MSSDKNNNNNNESPSLLPLPYVKKIQSVLHDNIGHLSTIDKMQHRRVSLASRKGIGKKIRKKFRLTPAMTASPSRW
jgi:hypothetical protein